MSDSPTTSQGRYPFWLGTLSFAWALLGWLLTAAAPMMAFLPGVRRP